MERVMTVEERIRRAEEIYERRKRNEGLTVVHNEKSQKEKNDKKDVKLLKKMIIQLIVCICIYFVIYTIQNNQYIFSEDFINKVNEIISYDIDFPQVYEDAKNYLIGVFSSQRENENQEHRSDLQKIESDLSVYQKGRVFRHAVHRGWKHGLSIGRGSGTGCAEYHDHF